jgi:hypothetical protein
MLGRLARMLRLLGYDTLYSPAMTTEELREHIRRGERTVLTRGDAAKRFGEVKGVFSVRSERPEEQLREVVEHFKLDARAGLWTRCTLCNGLIEPIEKAAVEGRVPPRVFEVYAEFFRCAACGHSYWRGSHVERTLAKLALILPE